MRAGKENYDRCGLKNPVSIVVFRAIGSALWSTADEGVQTDNFIPGHAGVLHCPRTETHTQRTGAFRTERRALRAIRSLAAQNVCGSCHFSGMTPLDYKEYTVRDMRLDAALHEAAAALVEARMAHEATLKQYDDINPPPREHIEATYPDEQSITPPAMLDQQTSA